MKHDQGISLVNTAFYKKKKKIASPEQQPKSTFPTKNK